MVDLDASRRWPRPSRTTQLLALVVAPLLIATIVGLVVLWPSADIGSDPSSFGAPTELVNATVVADRALPCDGGLPTPGGDDNICHITTVRLGSGPDRGTQAVLEIVEGPGQPPVKTGDRLVLGRTADETGVTYYFSDFQRRSSLMWLAALYVVVIVGIGRLRGLTSLIGVIVTFGLLLMFVLPAILEGSSPLAVAIVGSAASMFVILYLAHGVSAKTTAALLGTMASLAITGALAAFFVDGARLLNLGSDETAFIQLSAAQVNLQGLLLGGIIIGSLGVLNDVTVTQASAVWALRAANPSAAFSTIYRSAMRVGRDHIASTVDTLVLAYAGASLPLLLLFTLADRPVGDVLTGSLVAEEIVRTLVGGIGLAASVPITTALAVVIANRTAPPDDAPLNQIDPESTDGFPPGRGGVGGQGQADQGGDDPRTLQ